MTRAFLPAMRAKRGGRIVNVASISGRQGTALLGLDIHRALWIEPGNLEKGVRVKVLTPSGGKTVVTIPPRTETGSVFCLPGLGLSRGERCGDQYLHVESAA